MSATNSTANYNLPVFLATDKPAWLTDWNGAMNAIDTAIHTAQATADGAQTTAGTATADIATINASLSTITSNISSLTTTVNGNTGSINTINSLIGNGQPTTEDKTLIGAINEIYAMIGGGSTVTADVVSYDNTASGLSADNVQDAIDEVHNSSNIAYDNTTSGLSATNVKSAIDELATGTGGGYDLDITAHMGDCTLSPTSGVTFSDALGFSDVKYAINDDYSIGKIYGGIYAQIANGTLQAGENIIGTITTPNMPAITNSYDILVSYADMFNASTGAWYTTCPLRLRFNINGTISLVVNVPVGGVPSFIAHFGFMLPASLYFFEDFGN